MSTYPWERAQAEGQEQSVIARRLVFCQTLLQGYDEDERIVTCPDCGGFAAICCYHRPSACHHYSVVFTDGSCLNNGQRGAVSGIGIAFGEEPDMQVSVPITDTLDPDQKRSSQRAELLAALVAVQIGYPPHEDEKEDKRCIIITTDSQYVVKGMTEWFPGWKRNNWRTAAGKRPANLDSFLNLDAAIDQRESEEDIMIGFWHVPRRLNYIADDLAKEAAARAATLDVRH